MTQIDHRQALHRFFSSGGTDPHDDWLDAMARLMPTLAAHHGMGLVEIRHFLAQVGHESAGLSLANMRESLSYRPQRLIEVFAYRLRLAQKHHPEFNGLPIAEIARRACADRRELANVVYGGREGTPSDEGWRYIGRGGLQTTHLNNYRIARDIIRKQPGGESCPDLVETPEALEQPEWGVRGAFADWSRRNWGEAFGADDPVGQVSSIINTGKPNRIKLVNGLPDRRRWYARAVATFPDGIDMMAQAGITPRALRRGDVDRDGSTAVRDLQVELARLGYHSGEIDGSFGILTSDAVATFQRHNALEPTGIADGRTLAVLATSPPRDVGARAEKPTHEIAHVMGVAEGRSEKREGVWYLLGGGLSAGELTGVNRQVRESVDLFGMIRPLLDWAGKNPGTLIAIVGTVALVIGARKWWRGDWQAKRAAEAYRSGAYLEPTR